MQLLIDSTQETPASLRFIAATLCALADTYGPPLVLEPEPASINGPSAPIVLHAHAPAAPIDPRPVETSDPAQMDPAAVFARKDVYAGVIHQNIVPAGTSPDPTLPAVTSIPTAPMEYGINRGVPVFVPPAPLMTPATALPAIAALAAPSAGAPVAANAPAQDTAAAGTVSNDRDKDGLPWDVRIHSETRKTNADGTWRYRRNLDPTVKATVTAELKAQYGGQLTIQTGMVSLPTAPPPPPLVPQAPPAPTASVAPQPPAAPLPVSDGVPLGVSNTQQPAVLPALGFRDFMSAVNKALAAGRLTQDQLTNACKAVNLDGISALASEPGKISLVHSQIAHLLGAATA